jgi:uncharacterized membrane protein
MNSIPADARLLGFAGLLPQALLLLAALLGGPTWHFASLALGYMYAALIFSFLGGLWWGLAAASERASRRIYLVAVLPSLFALASAIPWIIGEKWPGPSLYLLATGLLASLLVDQRLAATGVAPPWWMSLRVPLSSGLALLTTGLAIVAG